MTRKSFAVTSGYMVDRGLSDAAIDSFLRGSYHDWRNIPGVNKNRPDAPWLHPDVPPGMEEAARRYFLSTPAGGYWKLEMARR